MINVPIAQSIRFRPVNSDLFNFDNLFEEFNPRLTNEFNQYVYPGDLLIQVVKEESSDTIAQVWILHDNTETRVTSESKITVAQVDYINFTVPFATYNTKQVQLEVKYLTDPVSDGGGGFTYTTTITHRSEYVTVLAQPKFYKLQWFNSENAYLMDYTTIVHEMYINARLSKMSMGGKTSIYSNQGEDVKLYSSSTRSFMFECELPDYIAEQISLAMDHDRFYINEVEYVTSEKPVINQLGSSNMCQFSVKVQQKTVIGINTHDVG